MGALKRRGHLVRAAKCGPDYIDPAFHAVATGRPSVNLDPWAMTTNDLRVRASGQDGDILIVEAAMGILDGAANGKGSAADLAGALQLPIVLVLDAAKAGPSVALPLVGLMTLRPDVEIAGVILNRVGSARHTRLATQAIPDRIPVLGAIHRSDHLILPERHLGLVQASETTGLNHFLSLAAETISDAVDLDALLARTGALADTGRVKNTMPPLGQRIAVASDRAFSFAYPHVLADWRSKGAEVLPFSPLANETPDPGADAIFLPGGYPELHAAQLSAASVFRSGMLDAATSGKTIYGECGGYMALGNSLVDADGTSHQMLGLLPLVTSFASRKLSLGYRLVKALEGPFQGTWAAHEFHYATVLSEGRADRLFSSSDATGQVMPDMGLRKENVSGSFAHLIAPAP